LAELCNILSAALARGFDSEHPGCRVLLELPLTEADYMRLRTIVEANSVIDMTSEGIKPTSPNARLDRPEGAKVTP
jgi:hypothetical protein